MKDRKRRGEQEGLEGKRKRKRGVKCTGDMLEWRGAL